MRELYDFFIVMFCVVFCAAAFMLGYHTATWDETVERYTQHIERGNI